MISHEGDNLVFLLSMPRSGSTLLSMMLGSHPEICCPPEPWLVLTVAEYLELGKVKSMPYGREWAEISTMEFLLSPERKRRGALGTFFHAAGEAAGLNPINAARGVLQSAYQMHLDTSDKSVFIDKTPRYYAVLGLLDEIFPRSKKIVLLRNPLDVFASYKSTWEITRSIFTPENVLVHTRDFCEGLFTLADYTDTSRNDVLVLRYEDLVSDPERSLQSACEFAGIDFLPTMLAYYENATLIEEYSRSPVGDPVSSRQPKPTNSQTVNAWEKRLDRDDIQALIDVVGINIFERLGYGDSVARLRSMPVSIPTEEQAFERRALLMRSLVNHVHEQPFSAWNNFVSPLKECLSDRAARLEVIHQQLADLEGLRQNLEVSESDRAALLEVIHQQQADMEGLRQNLEVSESDRAARLEVIHQQQANLEGLRQNLEVSESDRAARLEVIHQQLADLEGLRQNLEVSDALLEKQKMVTERQESDLENIKKWKGFFIFKLNQLKGQISGKPPQ